MEKKKLTAQATKTEFIESVWRWLMKTLKENNYEEYQSCFYIEGSSIMCELPENYFSNYIIPPNTKIEMKFVSKKG